MLREIIEKFLGGVFLIKVKNLTKEFKIRKKESGLKGAFKSLFSSEFDSKTAVSNISFEIKSGEIVGYIGSNGAGKSTTIKMMTGILTPSSGQVLVNGRVPYKEREKNAKDIGVVFGQRTQLWWDLALSETFTILKDIYSIPDEVYEKNILFIISAAHVLCIVIPMKTSKQTRILPIMPFIIISPKPTVEKVITEKYQNSIYIFII